VKWATCTVYKGFYNWPNETIKKMNSRLTTQTIPLAQKKFKEQKRCRLTRKNQNRGYKEVHAGQLL